MNNTLTRLQLPKHYLESIESGVKFKQLETTINKLIDKAIQQAFQLKYANSYEQINKETLFSYIRLVQRNLNIKNNHFWLFFSTEETARIFFEKQFSFFKNKHTEEYYTDLIKYYTYGAIKRKYPNYTWYEHNRHFGVTNFIENKRINIRTTTKSAIGDNITNANENTRIQALIRLGKAVFDAIFNNIDRINLRTHLATFEKQVFISAQSNLLADKTIDDLEAFITTYD